MKKTLVILTLSFIMFSFFKTQSSDIPELWNRLEQWLSKNAPHLVEELNDPATQQDIKTLEGIIGTALPEDYAAFLMIHNGQDRDSEGLMDSEELLSSERIAEEWSVWKELLDRGDFNEIESEPEEGIKKDWWNAKWIPISYDGGGNHYCIDLDPANGGTKGQIIRMWHDSEERELIAGSFKEWLANFVKDLESGQYVYDEDWGGIINIDDQ